MAAVGLSSQIYYLVENLLTRAFIIEMLVQMFDAIHQIFDKLAAGLSDGINYLSGWY